MSLTNSEYYVLHGKLDEERIMQLLAAEEDLQALLSVGDVVESALSKAQHIADRYRDSRVVEMLETINNKFKQIEGEF